MKLHQCYTQQENHFVWPTAYAVLNAFQDAKAHCWLVLSCSHQPTQVPSAVLLPSHLSPSPCLCLALLHSCSLNRQETIMLYLTPLATVECKIENKTKKTNAKLEYVYQVSVIKYKPPEKSVVLGHILIYPRDQLYFSSRDKRLWSKQELYLYLTFPVSLPN